VDGLSVHHGGHRVTGWSRRVRHLLDGRRCTAELSQEFISELCLDVGHLLHEVRWCPAEIQAEAIHQPARLLQTLH